MASSSTLSFASPSLHQTWDYDVFPSFHGNDVRRNFLSHVLKEFRGKSINFFVDNEMVRGKSIRPVLERAIRGSRIAVVLLSKNYASSSWCLDELVEIMKKELGQKVITIFYEVDPTVVKKQKGDFGKVFKKTCKGKDKEKVQTWKKALEGVATIAGYHSSNWDDEATMIEDIAVDISNMLNHLAPSPHCDRFIGMEAHMKMMKPLLHLELDEVRMVGILGQPGIGKTTIARFLFGKLSSSFQNSAFMENIKGNYPRSCPDEDFVKLQLQTQMLSKMFNHKSIEVSHLGVAPGRLRNSKVLLVLDDVDRLAQLEALAKNVQWFGPGSRIIITTEYLQLYRAHGINHIYKVDFPSFDEALQMFCMYAFEQKFPKDGFYELASEITYLVGRLPLGLQVMGSHFRGLYKEQWAMEVSRLRSNLNGDIERILKFSYDALCSEDKELFLHIACFFNGPKRDYVEEILAKRFKYLRQRLDVLAEKSLISIDDGYIYMHTLLAQLGEEIVRKDREPGQRKFLIEYEDISEILLPGYTTVTGSVIGIDSIYRLNITEKVFEGMSNLQFLRVGDRINYHVYNHQNFIYSRGPLTFISPKLQLLDWREFPMTCLRFTNDLEFLVELSMPGSKLEKLWDRIKLLRNLKRIILPGSRKLKELPNLSTATNLEELILSACSSLVDLPSSIENATNLKVLYLDGCSSLVDLPFSIGNATNLGELKLRECASLVGLPSSIGNLTNLYKLDLFACSSLVELPSSIGDLTNLYELELTGCSSLVELPSSIGNLTNLYKLKLGVCSSLLELPSSIMDLPHLDSLRISGCSSLVELPSSIWNAMGLSSRVEHPSSIWDATDRNYLGLHRLKSLVELPSSIGNLTNLETLSIRECSSLVSLPQLPDSIRFLDAENCESLERLDCSFCSPGVHLNFINCFKLNKEARDLIFQPSTFEFVILPGKEVPACFTYRAYGSSVTVKLNQKPLRRSTKFKACFLVDNKGENDARSLNGETICVYCTKKNKACILLDNKGEHEFAIQERGSLSCRIKFHVSESYPLSTEHLYIIQFEEEEMTSTELVFDFEMVDQCSRTRTINECGMMQLLEHHGYGDEEMCEQRSDQL